MDVKRQKGRLKIDSARVLAQSGWRQNIIDIDTYGSPWKHWAAMLPNITRPTTVFLTIGQVTMGGSGLDSTVRSCLGLGDLDIPPSIAAKINEIAVSWLLTMGCDKATIIEAIESTPGRHARYIGVRMEPKSGPAVAVTTTGPDTTS